MTPPHLWNAVKRRLEGELGPHALEAWVGPLVAERSGDTVRLLCPSPFHRERVRERMLDAIVRCLEAEAGEPVRVQLEVGASTARPQEPPPRAEPEPAPAPEPEPREEETRRPEPAPVPLQYRFESFVVGSCNALAREASLAIAEGRHAGLSTLYVSGASGLGKTHLAKAALASACERGARRALYVGAESFTSEFQAAIRSQGMPGFKRRYRGASDLLVVEDVQFFAGKKATQLELFHTVQHLLDAGGRVVFTADRLPREIHGLDPRLQSRMSAGLVAELETPDSEVRRRILRSRAAAGGVRLPEECLELLVDSLRGSVRDLEGALIQLVATASLLKRPIDAELTRAALHKVLPRAGRGRRVDPEDVIEVVATFFRTTPAALASRSRRRDVLLPRQLAMYLCRRYTDASLTRIGRAFDRDHPAVSNAVAAVERRMLERAPLRYQVEALCVRLEEQTSG